MKKIFHLSVIVVVVSVLASAGILWAGPVARYVRRTAKAALRGTVTFIAAGLRKLV